jgi:succinate dehydrogenase assembly factor 2
MFLRAVVQRTATRTRALLPARTFTTTFSLRSSSTTDQERDNVLLDDNNIPNPMANPRSTAELKKRYSDKTRARDFAIRLDHHTLKNEFPDHSFAPGQTSIDKDATNRKRLIYRSKQRGWLEVDLLLGTFAAEHIPTMNQEELDEYELILNQETLDIFNFIIERDPLPEELDTPVMQTLRDYAANHPIGKDPDGYFNAKKNMSN